MSDLVERVALAFCNKVPPCKMCRNDAKKAIAIALHEAAKVASKWDTSYKDSDGTIHYSRIGEDVAADIRALINNGEK